MRNLTPVLFAAAASVLSTAPAYADLGDQLAKLLADDGAVIDYFGSSVAISGTTAIVGAPKDDDNGSNSGSAYLFDISDPKNPVQIAKLLADDGAAGDIFGWSVAINGTTAIVGALEAAYLVDISDPANPAQIFKLLPDDGESFDEFGISVAISATTAIVGAWLDDDNGTWSGSAYLFDTITGRQMAKLLPDDGEAFDFFGLSVAISGAIAIVGAANDDDNGTDSGSAYLFDTTVGAQIAKLLAIDGANGDNFGISVAISGPPGNETAIVGANGDDDNGDLSGSAYLFDAATGRQIAKLLPDDGETFDKFGVSVAISGATAIVGASGDDDACPGDPLCNSGSAYLFDTTTGRQIAKLLADDGAESDFFGRPLAISGAPGKEIAIVGANRHNDNGTNSGSAYLFDAAAPGTCPWDLDENGSVGVSDFLSMLASWGPCPPKTDCPADFDGSGSVGVSDFLDLLANWGPCP